jgi:hypothetical protein
MIAITKKNLNLVVPMGTSLEDLGALQRALLGLLRNQREAPDPEELGIIADLLEATLLDNDQWQLFQQAAKQAA